MKLLALETATEACSVALYVDGQVLERFELAPRRHAELTLPWAEQLLAEAGIAAAEDKLNQLHAKISNLDRNVAVYASKHMRNYSFQGREVTPE